MRSSCSSSHSDSGCYLSKWLEYVVFPPQHSDISSRGETQTQIFMCRHEKPKMNTLNRKTHIYIDVATDHIF